MSNKPFIVVIAVLVIGFGVIVATKKAQPQAPVIGTQHADLGQKHLDSLTEKHAAYNSNLPSSGSHYVKPAPWGIETETVPDEQFVHNEEHGGVVVAYKPDMPETEVAKLKQIASNLTFTDSKDSIKGFKVLMFPRAKNDKPIELASWKCTLSLDEVSTATIKTFYRQHLNKSPEARAS